MGISNPRPVFIDLASEIGGYAYAKSFRRDILRGYLRNRPFVFMDLAGNANFRIYTGYLMVNQTA